MAKHLHPPKNQILKKKIKLNLEINIVNRFGKKIITPSPSADKNKEKNLNIFFNISGEKIYPNFITNPNNFSFYNILF
jgi:hypothetical protein